MRQLLPSPRLETNSGLGQAVAVEVDRSVLDSVVNIRI